MRRLRRVLGVAVLASRWLVRQPAWLVQDVLTVVAFLVILYAWGGAVAARNTVVAWMVAGAWGLVNTVGQEVGWSRVMGLIAVYIASPLRPVEYVAGVILAHLAAAPVELGAVLLLAAALGALSLVPAALAAAFLLMPVAVFTGIALAMLPRKPTNISALTNPVTMLLILLPPVFYPAAALPKPLRPLALAAPTGAAAELARSLSGYMPSFPAWQPLAALTAWNLVTAALAAKLIRWGHE